MKTFIAGTFAAVLTLLDISHAAEAFCTRSAISSCSKAIISTKTRTLSLTSFCSSVLGCTKTTTTISGADVTVTSTKTVTVTYSFDYIASETTTTFPFDYTTTTYTQVASVTANPTWTVEKFVITTRAVNGRDLGDEIQHPRNMRRAPTSICPSADETLACSCLIGGCAPAVTKDIRKTNKVVETETSYSIVDVPITYTNIEYDVSSFTQVIPYTDTITSAILSTHTTTIKCTPSATSSTSFFHLQATNAPPINGKYMWVASTPDRILSFSIEPTWTDDIAVASAFSLDDQGRLLSRHLNGTQYMNVDDFGPFELAHMIDRPEIQRRNYKYLYCSLKPASGKYAGGFKELYCIAKENFFKPDIFNFCPLYVEYFNAGLILGNEFSATAPACFAVVFLVKPICGWT